MHDEVQNQIFAEVLNRLILLQINNYGKISPLSRSETFQLHSIIYG